MAQFKKEVCLLIKSISKEADVNNSDQNSTEFEIKLTTLHSSKGLDADVVFIIGAEDQFIPNECLNQQEFYEKLRLFYVGITRAREQLFISYAKFRKDPLTKGYGGKRKRSRFLEDFYIPNKFKEKK